MPSPPAWLADLRETPAAFIPSMDLPALLTLVETLILGLVSAGCPMDEEPALGCARACSEERCPVGRALAAYRAGPGPS